MLSCFLLVLVSVTFAGNGTEPHQKMYWITKTLDTIPEKGKEEKMTMKEFDELSGKLDQATLDIKNQLSKMDLEKLQAQINDAFKNIDFEKVKAGIDKAAKEIDFAKLESDIQSSLKDIEWSKMNDEVKQSLQKAKKEMEKIDMEEVKKELNKAKIELERSSQEMKKINLDEIMKNAKSGIDKAKKELLLTKEMFNEMEKDELINQKNGFTVEYKNKDLFINGKKQTEAITDKYRKYIKGDNFKITITKEK